MILLHPDAMLAGNCPAHLDAAANDFGACGDGAAKFIAVAAIERNQRVQIAIARMKNVADLEAVLRPDRDCNKDTRISCLTLGGAHEGVLQNLQ